MEFGTLVPQGWRLDLAGIEGAAAKWDTCQRVIQGLDRDRWESLWVWDHFHTFPFKKVEATFECWTEMAAMAVLTSHARIGQIVTCNEYRHPAYLAKIAASVDVMSGGRVNLGLGAGWFQEEFDAYGYDYRTIGQRLARLGESCQVLKALWTQEHASFAGKHYTLVEAICEPKPIQNPHPPIWIGGRGEKVLLRLVAKYADVWNYNGTQDEFAHYRAVLEQHCKAVGRDFGEIRITAMSGGIAYESPAELDAYMHRIAAQAIDRSFLLQQVSCNGARAQCAEFLSQWKKLGVDGIIFYFNDIATYGDGQSQAEIFKRDVFPHV
jgi:F420-dependent oxidoreductase-like protein